jgi:hypothetical protein
MRSIDGNVVHLLLVDLPLIHRLFDRARTDKAVHYRKVLVRPPL